MNENRRAFYVCQFCGWGALFLLNIAARSLTSDIATNDIVANVVLFSLSVGVTSYLRRWIHARNLWQFGMLKMLAILLVVSLITTGLILLPGMVLSFGVCNLLGAPVALPTSSLVGNLVNFEILIVLWMSLYFLIHARRAAIQDELKTLRLKSSLKEAQLENLKSQIGPHFIFNCLNNIRSLVYEDREKTSEMITHLAELLRHSLTTKNDCHSVQEELEIIDSYIKLNTIQFENRLQFRLNCEPDCLRHNVPYMAVQMLVENAIKHGIQKLPEGGVLQVDILRSNQCVGRSLSIVVSNPVATNSSAEKSTKSVAMTGIGLTNLEERLQLLFGEKSSFVLKRENDSARAEISIPWSLAE